MIAMYTQVMDIQQRLGFECGEASEADGDADRLFARVSKHDVSRRMVTKFANERLLDVIVERSALAERITRVLVDHCKNSLLMRFVVQVSFEDLNWI